MADSVALTPEEQRRLRPLFGQYDLEDSSIVLGERIRPLLEKSGLQPSQLSQIWQIVDVDNRGFLDFYAFAKCMRLIAHAQQGHALSPKMANIPSGMPDFTRTPAPQPTQAPAPAQTLTAFSTGGSTLSANGETHIPPLTTVDKKRYGALFDRSVPASDGFLDGTIARDIFLKARLPEDTLAKIWSLVDIEGRGKLTKNEFVVAMHLIQCLITKVMPNVPSALPPSWHPWLGSGHARQGSIQMTGSGPTARVVSPPPPRSVGGGIRSPSVHSGPLQSPRLQSPAVQSPPAPSMPPSMPPSGVPASASAAATSSSESPLHAQGTGSIAIAPNERAQYDAIFDSLDKSKTGIIGPGEAVPLLTKSGLSEDVLAKVWDLADTRSRGQLDRGDFALAMHFVKAKLNGIELPEHVSPGAGAVKQSQQQPQSPSVPEPKIPSRSATQVSASSLTDLVSLDNAVFKPLEPAKPRRAATEVDERKFVPATSFGQQLLQKQQTRAPLQSPSPQQPEQQQPEQQQQQQQKQHQQQQQQQQSSMQAQSRNVQQLETQSNSVKAENARANEELASVLAQRANLDSRLKELRETYDAGTKQVHETQQQVKQIREEIKQLEKDIALRTSGLEAIKSQHAEELALRDSLLAKKQDLETQHTAAQAEIDSISKEVEGFQMEHKTHESNIAEHESRAQELQHEIEVSRWKRQQMEEAVQKHRERAVRAKEAADERAREAQREAEAAAEAENRAKIEADLAEQQIKEAEATHSKSAITPIASSNPAATPGTEERSINAGTTDTASHNAVTAAAAAGSLHRVGSLGSEWNVGSDNLASGTETPRTSPPTSEANFGAIDSSMPTFTLPMGRPHSVSSSVVNHAPQSVRGDLESELGEQQTPEFPSVTTEQAELARSDSFEFVDAQQSSDDEGPSEAIPHRYGPPSPNPHSGTPHYKATHGEEPPEMPGAFPKEFEEPLSSITNKAEEGKRQGLNEPAQKDKENKKFDEDQQQYEQPQLQTQAQSQTQPQAQTHVQSEVQTESHHQQTSAKSPVLSTAPRSSFASAATVTLPRQHDEFDEFDDLEEAREDESDDFNSPYTQPDPLNPASGPDEWQQLFANTDAAAPQTTTHMDPFGFSARRTSHPQPVSESREVAELTSMGFTVEEAQSALKLHNHNLSEATNYLLDHMQ